MSTKMKLKLVVTSILLLAVPMSYNSCSADHNGESSSAFSLSSSKACGLDNYFSRTWQPFLQKKCATCHVPGGQGKGGFAGNNLEIAYQAFSLAGFAKVGRYSVDAAHNPPYTGPGNQEKVNELLTNWAQAEIEAQQRCGADITEDGRIDEDFTQWMRTRSQGINGREVGDTQTLEFDLSTDLLDINLPESLDVSGVKLKITVEVRDNLGDVYYAIYDPVLEVANASEDLRISGIAVILNGQVIDDQTTFFYVDESKRDGDPDLPVLSSGAMIIQSTVRTTDTLALSIKTLENVDLGPRPAGVLANFTSNSATLAEAGTHTMTVQLSEPIFSNEVSVTVEADAFANAKDVFCGLEVVLDGDRTPTPIRCFDWDFQIPRRTLVFEPGQTSVSFDVVIQDDERFETQSQEQFRINIVNVAGGAQTGPTNQVEVTITEDDSPPTPGAVTYTDLMSGGGIFRRYCVKCHNSAADQIQQGGYDITNYISMKGSDVVVPGNPTLSKMIDRINRTGQGRMPINSQLDPLEALDIESWINAGAKND
jgi:mono/diheme cytochrome c family protein